MMGNGAEEAEVLMFSFLYTFLASSVLNAFSVL